MFNEIRKGNLTGFSIGGQAFKRINKSDAKHGNYTEISKLELHEVTICEKGINPEASFRILKEDTTMTNDIDALGELSSVIDRLSKQLDNMDKEDEQKGMMDMGEKKKKPDFLDMDKDGDKEESLAEALEDRDDEDDDDMDDKDGLKLAEDDRVDERLSLIKK